MCQEDVFFFVKNVLCTFIIFFTAAVIKLVDARFLAIFLLPFWLRSCGSTD
jgi:hypothetical protein